MKQLTLLLLLIFSFNLHAQTPELIFQSGYGTGVDTIDHDSSSIDLTGADNTLSAPNDWKYDLEYHPNMGRFKVQFKGGDETDRLAEIVDDPTDPTNKVLQFWIQEVNSGNNGRVQGNLYENNDLYNIFYSTRLYIPGDFNLLKEAPFDFKFVLMEFWNNANWTDEDYMFRLKVNLGKLIDETDSLKLRVSGQIRDVEQDKWGDDIWEYTNSDYVVPIQKWMTIRIYFVEGGACGGRFVMTITPEGEPETTVFNVRNYTHHPEDPSPDGLSHFNPFKLYTDDELVDYMNGVNGMLNLYWDDFELWKDSILTSDQLCLQGGVTFNTQDQIDSFKINYPECNLISGDLVIQSNGNNISNLDSLAQLTAVRGSLIIEANDALNSLSGLENLNCIGKNLQINDNSNLTDITALSNVRSLNGILEIKNNDALSSLKGLDNISFIGGVLTISNNDALTSLEGIESIDPLWITNLTIENSAALSLCALENICEYIDEEGAATISANAVGCNSIAEVEAECLTLLPVELIGFNGKHDQGHNILTWQTATELNNDYFQVEHSFDGRYFESIGSVLGQGTSSTQHNYQFVHKNVKDGIHYYRLKQVDYDGQFEYSKIISIDFSNDGIIFLPNPTSGLVQINGVN